MPIKHIEINHWNQRFSEEIQQQAIDSLEKGKVLFIKDLSFILFPEEKQFLTPEFANPKNKNISYLPNSDKLRGVCHLSDEKTHLLKAMMKRYSYDADKFIKSLFPKYVKDIVIGRTSYRPVQISGRKTSYRKDDKRLHVDAFPSSPNQGKRILRIFTNINPNTQARVWRIGEPFEKVLEKFSDKLSYPFKIKSMFLKFFHLTKSYRTLYDHFMLQLHDSMKADNDYQKNAPQTEFHFPAGSSWIVQTDHVSHAAMQGQYVLEQTFYLPINAMQNESLSPLRIFENHLRCNLV